MQWRRVLSTSKELALVMKIKLEIRVSQNLAKLGRGCTASQNFGGVSICVRGFPLFYFVFVETKNVGRRSLPFTVCHLCLSCSTTGVPIIPLSDIIETLLRCCQATAQTSSTIHTHTHTYIYVYMYIYR